MEQLIARSELEPVTGAAADGGPLLDQARRTAATAAALVSSDPYSAYVLAYDAARFACIALLSCAEIPKWAVSDALPAPCPGRMFHIRPGSTPGTNAR
jgi:hypothetical protein